MPSQKSTSFVEYVLNSIQNQKSKGFVSKLKKADNELTEYQSWEILSQWINLDYERDRRAYGLIGASLARSKLQSDGLIGLGQALSQVFYQDGNNGELNNSPVALRLRRLLACRDALELITIMRPILRYLESKDIPFSRAQVLDNLLWFDHDQSRDRIRSRWAQDFFRKKEES